MRVAFFEASVCYADELWVFFEIDNVRYSLITATRSYSFTQFGYYVFGRSLFLYYRSHPLYMISFMSAASNIGFIFLIYNIVLELEI